MNEYIRVVQGLHCPKYVIENTCKLIFVNKENFCCSYREICFCLWINYNNERNKL